jgi:hypothetical protein
MRGKKVLLGLGVGLLAAGAALAGAVAVLRHEPAFYRRAAVPAGPERQQHCSAFLHEFAHLVNGITNQDKKWFATFTDVQINSYFEEDFLTGGHGQKLLPEGISEPRVAIEPDKLRLAFRYGCEPWSTVIAIDLRLWLAPKEPNVVAVELQGLHAGALPVFAQSLLERASEVARRRNIDVTWYRHQGNPVALLRFKGDQQRPTVQLRQVELRQGTISIVGQSLEPAPRGFAPPVSKTSP